MGESIERGQPVKENGLSTELSDKNEEHDLTERKTSRKG